MTRAELVNSIVEVKHATQPLSYYYFIEELDIHEIATMQILFPENRFSNRVSQSGNIFLTLPEHDNVMWILPYQSLRSHMDLVTNVESQMDDLPY